MTRCSWVSGDLAAPMGCTAPASRWGMCPMHALDAEREMLLERVAEAERDVVRAIHALRVIGVDLSPWRACVARMRGVTTRRIAAAMLDGAPLSGELLHAQVRILDRLPELPASAADYRHLDALRALDCIGLTTERRAA